VFTAVADRSQVAEARRLVGVLAGRIGLPPGRIDQVAIVVTELATNLLKHGGGGHIHAIQCDDADGAGLELLAWDRGRGMTDAARCMQDGYSTAGSPGNGLGAVARLADTVRIYSQPGQGCAIMARFIERPPPGTRVLLGAALAAYPNEPVCGDNWTWKDSVNGNTIMLVDGSGHGIEAARAAETAVRTFSQHADAACEDLVERMHRALAPTRGGALAVARIDAAARVVRFVGVGNISAVLVNAGKPRHMVSHNGTAGYMAPRIREFTYDFSGDPLVILHSDGLTSRWDLASYPGLAAQHPSLIAGVLLRDHRRGRDDASVVAMRLAT
jgi:anti-sigma regulatory factor (Ser/Thr protein kinase)